MPRGFLRLLIAIALALAVPMQGFAAAAGAICMAVGHHDAPPAHTHDSDEGAHHHANEDAQPGDGSAHCPPCAACCASAAIAPSAMLLQPDEQTEVLNALAPPVFAGIQRTLLDRPPLAL